MKIKILLFALFTLFLSFATQAQVPGRVKSYANAAGRKLCECCSFSHTNLEVTVSDWWKNEETEKYVIKMTVSWKGGVSGKRYWIKGSLKCSYGGCKATWSKESDSGGFSPGCGSECPLGCLEE